MNLKRILTGLIGLPIIAIILIFGNKYLIDIIFAIISLISIHEYFQAVSKKYKPIKILGYIATLLTVFIHIIPAKILSNILMILIPVIITILFIRIIQTKMEINFNDIAITLFGIIYIIGFISFIPMLYGAKNGKILIWYILISAWGSDTFAYMIGKKFGKHKLSIVSPKKSVEGSIGGIVGATALGLIYTICINNIARLDINYILITLILIGLSILGQIGDLAASSIKRYVDIKDFGNILPGHGGILDRIDSIILIAPFAYFLLTII